MTLETLIPFAYFEVIYAKWGIMKATGVVLTAFTFILWLVLKIVFRKNTNADMKFKILAIKYLIILQLVCLSVLFLIHDFDKTAQEMYEILIKRGEK